MNIGHYKSYVYGLGIGPSMNCLADDEVYVPSVLVNINGNTGLLLASDPSYSEAYTFVDTVQGLEDPFVMTISDPTPFSSRLYKGDSRGVLFYKLYARRVEHLE